MFDNIGSKIKTLAIIECWIGIIASVVAAFALWSENSRYNPTTTLGLVVLIGGCLISWIGSYFTYAIGEIAENSEQQSTLLRDLCKEQKKTNEYLLALQKDSVAEKKAEKTKVAKNVNEYLPEL